MKITFAEDGWSEYLYWRTQDKKILKKINQLLQSIERWSVARIRKTRVAKIWKVWGI